MRQDNIGVRKHENEAAQWAFGAKMMAYQRSASFLRHLPAGILLNNRYCASNKIN